MTFLSFLRVASLTGLALIASLTASAQIGQPAADGPTVVIRSQHRRLTFADDVQRIAVGDPEVMSAELITSREVLVLGRQTGRTTLIVWFANGLSRDYLFSIERDLSVLERALKLIHPSIEVQSAPDRDALILTGVVPDVSVSQSAEAVARNYLDAGGTIRGGAQAFIAAAASGGPASPAGQTAPAAPTAPAPGTAAPPPTSATSQLQGAVPSSGTIINLLQLETLPPLPEQKIREAIADLGGGNVTVRRMLRGNVRDDGRDTLVLEGRVPNQVALVRVLTVAAQLFAGQTITAQDIRVVADEAGALADQQAQGQGNQQTQLGGGGAASSLFGGSRGGRLSNQVRTNLGRAKAIEIANGRVLSFIEVSDLPQVRVDIRLEEINRSKLKSFDANAALLSSSFRQPSLQPAQSATAVQGDQAARVGTSGAAIQNVLSFLNGSFLSQLQYAGANAAIDATLSLLEREGVARSLSSPSLSVLSGEVAQVQVGGEIPVPTAFAPAFGGGAIGGAQGQAGQGSTPGVFTGTEFVPFGVTLQIRPLVGDDDTITLDVQPLVVFPDAVLTDSIRRTTGASLNTTAFQTRGLRTSSRLQDGQSLLIGGLTSNNSSTNTASLPGARRVPIVGRLFQNFNNNDQETELVVVVNPVILRMPVAEAALWAFPDRDEMMRSLMAGIGQ